jgi:predicted Zn-dependent protease
MKRTILTIALVMTTLLVANAARAFDIGSAINTGVIGLSKVAEASKDITPGEEHYIGRSIAAMVVNKYPLVQNQALTDYVNKVGLLVAYNSDRPETYGGYHFGVVESSEANAFACPGGFIFVTTGLLRQVSGEDELATIIGHEVAHVAHRDGINAIKKSKWTDLGFYAAGQAAGKFSPDEVKQLTSVFSDVVTDVGKKVLESGYSQSDEKKADESGVRYASSAGYDPNGIITFLEAEQGKGIDAHRGPYASHPKTESRIKELKAEIEKENLSRKIAEVRTNRYKQSVAFAR